MAENQMTLSVVARKNNNTHSLAYGKYYFEADNSKTLSWRGFLNHLAQHALNYPRPIIDGVAAQLVSCLAELLLQGQPVKIDGLGTFTISIQNKKGGATKANLQADDFTVTEYLQGARVRFIPDNTKLDSLSKSTMLSRAAIDFRGIAAVETSTVDEKTVKASVLTPFALWKQKQLENNGQ